MKKAIKNTTIADRILFLLLILVSVAGIFYSREALSQGNDVLIEVQGKPVYTLSLDANSEVVVDGTHGRAVVEISDRRVRVKEADCHHHICMKQGWITGGSIVCLPNGIVVIVGSGTKKGLDAVSG